MMTFNKFLENKGLGDIGKEDDHLKRIADITMNKFPEDFLDFCYRMSKKDKEIELEFKNYKKRKKGIVIKKDYDSSSEPTIIAKPNSDYGEGGEDE